MLSSLKELYLLNMKYFLLMLLTITLSACNSVSGKPIEQREVQVSTITNRLELGDNWNNVDVTKAEEIVPIKHPNYDWFFDK